MHNPTGIQRGRDRASAGSGYGEGASSVTAPAAGLVRTPHRWRALGVICLCVTVIVLDNTILNVALPSIERSLHASASDLQWMVDAYTLTFASLLLVAGNLGDKYGRRGALLVGLVIFGVGSGLAAFATSATALIAFRALMGIGGAAIFPTTLSIIDNIFEGDERGRAIGIWAGLSGLGLAAGPIVGGLLLDQFWWGSVLLVNVPIVAISIVLVVLYVPTSKDEHAPPLDIAGAVLATVGMTALIYGIIEAPGKGWGSTEVVVALALALVVLIAFVLREHSARHPMLPVQFFADRRFSAASGALALTFFGLSGYIFLLTQYLQFVRGLDPLEDGVRLAAPALGILVSAPLAPRLAERIGTKVIVGLGLGLAAVSMVFLSRTWILDDDLWLAVMFVIFGFGMGLTIAPATESIMGSVPRERAGVGSAVNDTTRQLGGVLGVAVIGSILVSRYDSRVDAVALPASARSAARSSIGAALRVADQLGGDAGRRLVAAARAGFVDGFQFATLVTATVIGVAVVVVVLFLPNRATAKDSPQAEEAVRPPLGCRYSTSTLWAGALHGDEASGTPELSDVGSPHPS
jgi:EmrB/QacA subfamily drug resistance transporter